MPKQTRKYAVMYVPRSGLFFSGGDFVDGNTNRIPWSRTIPIWTSRAAALAARERLRKKWAKSQGDFVLVSVVLVKGKGDENIEGDEYFQDDMLPDDATE